MYKFVKFLLAGVLLTATATAYAIDPGVYVARGSDNIEGGVYGEIKICKIQGDEKLPSFEVFSVVTRDGLEPIQYFAGIINQNSPKSLVASGTVMYNMSNQQRVGAMRKDCFQTGKWLHEIDDTKSNIRFKFSKTGNIDYDFPNDELKNKLGIISGNGFRIISGKVEAEADTAMKIVALAKLRSLMGESFNIYNQSYVNLPLFDESKTTNLIVKENDLLKTFSFKNGLTNITDITIPQKPHKLLDAVELQTVFGNASCTGSDVLVRNGTSRDSEVIGKLQKNEPVFFYFNDEGESIDGNNKWSFVGLSNGKQGYVYSPYIKLY